MVDFTKNLHHLREDVYQPLDAMSVLHYLVLLITQLHWDAIKMPPSCHPICFPECFHININILCIALQTATLTYDTLRFGEFEDFPETSEPVWILGKQSNALTGN